MNCEITDFNALRAALKRMTAFLDGLPEDALFDCKLVANELLSNALEYGGGHARFAVERCGDRIRISVKSGGGFRPPETSRCSDVYAERGRGLFLVDNLASSRTFSEEDGISVVVLIEK